MNDLIAFINARYDDEEQVARAADRYWHGVRIESATMAEEDHVRRHDPARVLADLAAKRKILEIHGTGTDPCDAHDASMLSIPCDTLLALAQPYDLHPDWREEWRV